MIALLLSILCSSSIYILFKLSGKQGLKNKHIIVINYLVATILGFSLHQGSVSELIRPDKSWLWLAALIGVSFVLMFHAIAWASQKAGVGITSLATRLSVVVPIAFSIYIDPHDQLSLVKTGIIAFTLIALFMSVYKKEDSGIKKQHVILPFVLFLGAGTVDSMVKYGQQMYVDEQNLPVFSAWLFLVSFASAILMSLFSRDRFTGLFDRKTLLFGLLLGLANYGTIFFIVGALESGFVDSSVIFAANNIGIVAVSVALAIALFREKLSKLNLAGIILSLIALVLLFVYL